MTTVSAAIAVLTGRRIAVLTGAGISTDSGIPDYRGEGTPVRTPTSMQEFMADDRVRARLWIGSHLGWRAFAAAEPNAGHRALADMESAGTVTGVVTQNVDGLHLRAGSRRVVELHGAMRRVVCTSCRQVFDRRDLAARIEADNPWLSHESPDELGPDGDVVPRRIDGFVVPVCTACAGILKPDVVFFGEYIPAARFHAAEQILLSADTFVVAGSSLVVNSGMRLIERARRRRLPLVIINRGPTRADNHATVKIDAGTSDVLGELAEALASIRTHPLAASS